MPNGHRRIYLDGRYRKREMLLAFAAWLKTNNFIITSRWIKGGHIISDDELGNGEVYRQLGERYAREDLADIDHADLVICFSETPHTVSSRGGRHVELGYALATGKDIWVIGPIENAFHCLSEIRRFQTLEECMAVLAKEATMPQQTHPSPEEVGEQFFYTGDKSP